MAYSDIIDELTIGSSDTDYQYITNIEGDTMTGTVQDNKEAFDKYPNLIASKHNLMLNEFQNLISSVVSEQIVKTSMLNMFYPVGSYYETSNSNFNPNTAWGGTWVLETAGQVHVSAGTGYTVGSTGGNKDAIIPSHNHTFTGNALATHTHSFSGNAVSGHTHSVSATTVAGGLHSHSATITVTRDYSSHNHTAGTGSTDRFLMGRNMERVRATTYGQSTSSGNKYIFANADVDDLWTTTVTQYDGGHLHGATASIGNSTTHSHTVNVSESTAGGHTPSGTNSSVSAGTPSGTISTVGTSVTDANMQPYIVVNRWHRTA